MRAFIAIDLPESLRAALRRQQDELRRICPDARWTRPEGIHLTLKFLGEIPTGQVGQVADAVAGLGAFEKFSIEVKGYGFFPDVRRPRVFWVGVGAPPALAELASGVESATETLGFAREQRAFAPHLTLARFPSPHPQPALLARLKQAAQKPESLLLGRFEVSEFFLFESKLSPQGAEYRKVVRFPR